MIRSSSRASTSALTAALGIGLVLAACDTEMPSELVDAYEEVMADRVETSPELAVTTPPMLIVDGVRIVGPGHDEGDLRLILIEHVPEPDQIDRVEVLKGPAAQKLYGEEAAAGVIQIFTKDWAPADDGPADDESESELVVTEPSEEALDLSSVLIRYKGPGVADPVIYVDGIRIDPDAEGGAAVMPAPDDIDRIEVIKGEAAKELYGAEGARGVIQIFTKGS